MQNQYNIIILNWNGWHDTQKCIESILLNNKSNNYTIIVVDNGSKIDDLRVMEHYLINNFKQIINNDKEYFLSGNVSIPVEFENAKSCDKVILIKNHENLGFAMGNNVALKFLQKIGKSYAILLNNDTEIEDYALDKMFFFYQSQNNVGAVVPQIRYYEPKNLIWNCGGMINFLGIRKYKYAFKDFNDVPQEGFDKIDYGTGCAILFNIEKVGILTEKFFFGEEDMEFAFRMKKMNLNVYCLYESLIYHKVGASRNQISENQIGKMAYHYSQRISNLKDNLIYPIWLLSVLAHIMSSIRLLKKNNSFSVTTVFNFWKVILKMTNKKSFKLEDFKKISNDNY